MRTVLVINFSGSVAIKADSVKFENLSDEAGPETITGEEWLELSTDEQENYVLESLGMALCQTDSAEYDEITVSELV